MKYIFTYDFYEVRKMSNIELVSCLSKYRRMKPKCVLSDAILTLYLDEILFRFIMSADDIRPFPCDQEDFPDKPEELPFP